MSIILLLTDVSFLQNDIVPNNLLFGGCMAASTKHHIYFIFFKSHHQHQELQPSLTVHSGLQPSLAVCPPPKIRGVVKSRSQTNKVQ